MLFMCAIEVSERFLTICIRQTVVIVHGTVRAVIFLTNIKHWTIVVVAKLRSGK